MSGRVGMGHVFKLEARPLYSFFAGLSGFFSFRQKVFENAPGFVQALLIFLTRLLAEAFSWLL